MTSIDDKIKQALNEEFKDVINDNDVYDSSLIKRFELGFKGGKLKKSYRTVYIIIVISYIICGLFAYKFAGSVDIKMSLAYITSALFFAIFSMLGEFWYYSEMGRNRVIREIKLVELQLNQVLKNQEK